MPWRSLVALVALSGAACRPGASAVPTVLVVTELQGLTEPCGCTSRPLGGLDRLAAKLEARPRGAVWVHVGNALTQTAAPAAHLEAQESRRVEVVASVLGRLAPVATAPGSFDRASPHAGPRSARWDALSPALHDVGGLPVGFVRVEGGKADAPSHEVCAAADAQASQLRARGASAVVGLAAERSLGALACWSTAGALDVLVLPGTHGEPTPARRAGRVLVVDAGDQGRFVGSLELHGRGDAWAYFDAGRAERASVDARIKRMEAELGELEPGPARDARERKLTQLRADREAIAPPPPTGPYLEWTVSEVGPETQRTPWVRDLLAGYNASLCDATRAATAERECPPPASPGERYVGNEGCRACHAAAFAVYDTTKHARAWKTLVDEGKSCDLGCIGCHTTGYEQPGGFCRLADAERFANNGCENCHGPGAAHAARPGERGAWGARFTRDAPEATCRRCHNPEHSDRFVFDAYRARILGPGHGAPLPVGAPHD